jgi:hypothetical protein
MNGTPILPSLPENNSVSIFRILLQKVIKYLGQKIRMILQGIVFRERRLIPNFFTNKDNRKICRKSRKPIEGLLIWEILGDAGTPHLSQQKNPRTFPISEQKWYKRKKENLTKNVWKICLPVKHLLFGKLRNFPNIRKMLFLNFI